MLGIAVILLIVVLFVNQGQEIKRWMPLGPFDVQPSEIAKFSFLIYLSSWLSRKRQQISNTEEKFIEHLKKEVLPFLLMLGGVSFLIVIEPDMDTTIMLGVTSFIVYFLSGKDRMHMIGSLFMGAISSIIVIIATLGAKYRIERLSTFFSFWKTGNIPDPLNTGYQFKQILVAVASGGWVGLGFGQSKQKFLYLGDTAFSDTIFAIVAEEFGLIGSIAIISLFAFIFFKGFKIATRATDKLGYLIAISITTWITFQAVLHIGANVALIPINGNTLPFLSYGGSSTIVNLAAIGVLLNVASQNSPQHTNAFVGQRQSLSKDVIIQKRSRIKR
jgi:cell division protein FtsW